MSTLRRTAIAGIGLAASLVLAGCAGGSGGSGADGSDSGKTNQSPTPQASGGPQIANPKNASAVDVCSLLPADAAAALGVKPQGKTKSNPLNPDLPDACKWESPDGGAKKVGFTALDGRSIQAYYKNADSYVDFKKLTIAGYPAVRANKDDPMSGGSCDVFLATKKNQVVHAYARTPKVGQVNPCEISKKALELSVPTWPAAK